MLRLLIALLIAAISIATPVHGEECDGDICIDVSADDDNHIVIKVKKSKPGTTTTSSPSPRPTTTAISRKPWIPWLPKPATTSTPRLKSTKISKPRVRKPEFRDQRFTLADQVKRMIPNGVILTQPMSAALLREPVNFLTTVPASFQTVIVVLEVPIFITLKALYKWDFGEGNFQTTTHPGAPFPAAPIKNKYLEPGEYEVGLKVTWTGTWRAGALTGPIKGSINQNFERVISIYEADTTFTR